MVSSEPSLRIIPGTGPSSPLSSLLSVSALSALWPGSHFTGCLKTGTELLHSWQYVTLLGLTAWHVMTPRQQGNEVKIGQIRIILRMRVRPWLPIIIRVSIVGITAASCRHGGHWHLLSPGHYAELTILCSGDTQSVWLCCTVVITEAGVKGPGGPSSQPRLLIQILTINCALMVVYPFVVPNSPPRGYKVASCLLAHSFCNLIYHNDE